MVHGHSCYSSKYGVLPYITPSYENEYIHARVGFYVILIYWNNAVDIKNTSALKLQNSLYNWKRINLLEMLYLFFALIKNC